MKTKLFKQVLSAFALIAGLGGMITATQSVAQGYPDKPIRIIVPYGTGGGTDILTRNIADRLAKKLGQSIIVENRPGANGVLGAQAVKSAAPDGYTFCMGATSSHSIVAAMRPNSMPYDIEKDFTPIGLAAISANIIAVHPSVPVKNLQELIA